MADPIPLPYVVNLKVIDSVDLPPRHHEWKGLAYNLIEATTQAFIQCAGTTEIDVGKIKIESAGPDLETYIKMFRGKR